MIGVALLSVFYSKESYGFSLGQISTESKDYILLGFVKNNEALNVNVLGMTFIF